MATRVSESAVFNIPLDKLWKELRDFTFPARLLDTTVESCVVDDGLPPFCVGATRTMKWKSGEERKHRLLQLDDQFHRLTYELIYSEPISEVSAAITSITLHRITETNSTLVVWASDFSADTNPEFVKFETKAYQENLKEIRSKLNA
eukprot:TRINITY_DN251_c0_g1_i1.p1 TRINITY_DN251_c0_g1~~TRINITY_DN251_c0_g1_i1.p1  ORF type:complete len:147 (-),score=40.36 TRINITY_DN251_c0_g1_i1:113-553(-)